MSENKIKHNTILITAASACIVVGTTGITAAIYCHIPISNIFLSPVLVLWGTAMLWFSLSTRKHFR